MNYLLVFPVVFESRKFLLGTLENCFLAFFFDLTSLASVENFTKILLGYFGQILKLTELKKYQCSIVTCKFGGLI